MAVHKLRMKAKKKRYSYIRNPYSSSGWYSFFLGCISLVLTCVLLYQSVRGDGNVSLFMASAGLAAMLAAFTGIVFMIGSLTERKVNHTFAVAGGLMALAVLAVWAVVMFAV